MNKSGVDVTAWHSMEAAQALKELDTHLESGLTEDEASRRLQKYGYNELAKKEQRISPLAIFLDQFKNILIAILLVAAVLSAVIGEWTGAVLILVIVIFCAALGFAQEYRAERALEALKKMLSPTTTVLREGREQEIPSRELVPGDILLLEAGDRIPADARLVESHSLMCDEASLTGESLPVDKETKPLPENVRVSDRKNMVFAGTTVTYGRSKTVVTSTGINTEFGEIVEAVTAVKAETTPLAKRMAEIGKWLGIICLAVCFLVLIISMLRHTLGGSPIDLPFVVTMVMFAVALAVAAVPEALPAIVTGALAVGMRQMAKRNALVRKMPAVETLGCVTVICSDKTGTLTKGEMTVRRIFGGGRMIEVSGAGYAPVGELRGSGAISTSNDLSLQLFFLAGTLCNDAVLQEEEGRWSIQGDPTEGALVVAAEKAGVRQHETRQQNPRIEEIPFSSERMRMTTVHRMKSGKTVAFMKGAPEVVLERCSSISTDRRVRELGETERAQIMAVGEEMAQEALRVLGVAYRELKDGIAYTEETAEKDMTFLGLAGMMDPPRQEVMEAVKVCKQVHIKPIVITGDHQLTAVAIAREIGIYTEGDMVLTGEELEKMSDKEYENIVDKVTVYARVSPIDKLKIVRAWQKKGEVVAMTGDGVNDAPALKQADIGVAMGITGTDVSKEAADMVLGDDNFATIVRAIESGRWIYDNIKKYLVYLLESNVIEVAFIGGVVLITGPQFLPVLPAAILYINLATDGLPAIALAVSPPDPDIMQRPPRDPKESVFAWDVRAFILMILIIEIPILSYLFFSGRGDMTDIRTQIFFFFVITEFVISLNLRSVKYSIFKAPPHKWLLLSIAFNIVALVVLIQIPAVLDTFGVRRLLPSDLGIIIGSCVVITIGMEVVKGILRKNVPPGRRTTP